MARPKKIEVDIQAEASNLFRDEVTAWDEALVFVTEKVAFPMRNLIRQARKNYYGVFDQETDPVTKRKKTWIPLTQSLVEAVVKNIDLDTKDINFRAKHPKAVGLTSFVRNLVRNWLDQHYFGQDLDMTERQLAIDGTAVWKTMEVQGKMVRKTVDLLNFYIDPAASSIQETPSVIERIIITPKEFDEQAEREGFINKDQAVGTTNVHPTEMNFNRVAPRSPQKMVEVYERWGLIPLSLITGKKKDEKEFVEGRMVASKNGSAYTIHLIEKNTTKDTEGNIIKPYEEAWLRRVPGRWHGIGIPEQVLMLQKWINTVVNIRINRAYVTQLGIFKIRAGSGVTPSMVSQMASNGAIVVNNLDDIDQFVMQEASQASYNDEQNVVDWSERVTSAFQAVTGEAMPSSKSATSTVIENRNAQSSFVLIKEGIGFFLQRWTKRHALPILARNLKRDEVVRMSGDFNEMRQLDERLANHLVYKKLEEESNKPDGVFSRMRGDLDMMYTGLALKLQAEREGALEKLRSMGNDRWAQLAEKIDFTKYDVQVFITNEEMDKGVMSQNLVAALKLAPPGAQQVILRQLFDMMGLDVNQLDSAQESFQLAQAQQDQQGQQQLQGAVRVPGEQQPSRGVQRAPSEQRVTTEANTV